MSYSYKHNRNPQTNSRLPRSFVNPSTFSPATLPENQPTPQAPALPNQPSYPDPQPYINLENHLKAESAARIEGDTQLRIYAERLTAREREIREQNAMRLQNYLESRINEESYARMVETQRALSAIPPGYQLPPASTTAMGGVIVGDGLQIDSSGILSASIQGQGPTIHSMPGRLPTDKDGAVGDIWIYNNCLYVKFTPEANSVMGVALYPLANKTGVPYKAAGMYEQLPYTYKDHPVFRNPFGFYLYYEPEGWKRWCLNHQPGNNDDEIPLALALEEGYVEPADFKDFSFREQTDSRLLGKRPVARIKNIQTPAWRVAIKGV